MYSFQPRERRVLQMDTYTLDRQFRNVLIKPKTELPAESITLNRLPVVK